MMTLFALPQPGPPRVAGAGLALAFNRRSWPSERPRMLEPPMRNRSRRAIFACVSQRSVLSPPGRRIMAVPFVLGCGEGEQSLGDLPVEQKRGVVDQRPGQILRTGQSLVR